MGDRIKRVEVGIYFIVGRERICTVGALLTDTHKLIILFPSIFKSLKVYATFVYEQKYIS